MAKDKVETIESVKEMLSASLAEVATLKGDLETAKEENSELVILNEELSGSVADLKSKVKTLEENKPAKADKEAPVLGLIQGIRFSGKRIPYGTSKEALKSEFKLSEDQIESLKDKFGYIQKEK